VRDHVQTFQSVGNILLRVIKGFRRALMTKGAMELIANTSASSGVDISCMRRIHELVWRRSTCCAFTSTIPTRQTWLNTGHITLGDKVLLVRDCAPDKTYLPGSVPCRQHRHQQAAPTVTALLTSDPECSRQYTQCHRQIPAARLRRTTWHDLR
jgi:hypothetical protein